MQKQAEIEAGETPEAEAERLKQDCRESGDSYVTCEEAELPRAEWCYLCSAVDKLAERDALRQKVEGLEQWQPIETAPKDGARVLLFWSYWHSYPVVGRFTTRAIWESDIATSAEGEGPTHWMPLPSPPPQEPQP